MTENNKKLWDRAVSGIKEEYTDEAAERIEDMTNNNLFDNELDVYEKPDKKKFPVFAVAAGVAAVIGVTVLTAIVIINISLAVTPLDSSEPDSSSIANSSEESKNPSKNETSSEGEASSENESSQIIDAGDYLYDFLDDGTIAITGYKGSDKAVVIPGEIDGKAVAEIGEDAFKEKNIEEVVIPSGVTAIRNNVFYGCRELEKVTLPDTLCEIGSSAFYDCESLTEIKIPEGVEKIEKYTFLRCEDLEKVELPDGLESIGLSAFYGCGFKEITLPESVTTIDGWAFAYNEALERIYLPKKVKAEGFGGIYYYQEGNSPFLGCLYLEAIEVDPDNRELYSEDGVLYTKGDNRLIAYPEGKKAEEFKIPEGVKAIGKLPTSGSLVVGGYVVFEGNGYLKKLILPESLISIDMHAFKKVDWDLYIEFPEGISDITISDKAFEYCSGIIFLCRENSVAHQYAKEHDLRFEIIE